MISKDEIREVWQVLKWCIILGASGLGCIGAIVVASSPSNRQPIDGLVASLVITMTWVIVGGLLGLFAGLFFSFGELQTIRANRRKHTNRYGIRK